MEYKSEKLEKILRRMDEIAERNNSEFDKSINRLFFALILFTLYYSILEIFF